MGKILISLSIILAAVICAPVLVWLGKKALKVFSLWELLWSTEEEKPKPKKKKNKK
jgi:hypothetical protein